MSVPWAAWMLGRDVGLVAVDPVRRVDRLAGEGHDAAHRLADDVGVRPARVRAGLAEAGDRGVDERRRRRVELLVAQARAPAR